MENRETADAGVKNAYGTVLVHFGFWIADFGLKTDGEGIVKGNFPQSKIQNLKSKITHAAAHLMCYQAKPATGQTPHIKVLGIHTANQFGPEQLDTVKEEELCVPSEKILGGG